MRGLAAAAVLIATTVTPAQAGSQFFINIPSIVLGLGGGGYGYPPPPPYPPQYAPQYPVYGGYYYYKGDYPQYAYGQGYGASGGYYDGYQGGYGYRKHRHQKPWKAPVEEVPVDDGGTQGHQFNPPPGCNKPPMCTGGKPWRPQQ